MTSVEYWTTNKLFIIQAKNIYFWKGLLWLYTSPEILFYFEIDILSILCKKKPVFFEIDIPSNPVKNICILRIPEIHGFFYKNIYFIRTQVLEGQQLKKSEGLICLRMLKNILGNNVVML